MGIKDVIETVKRPTTLFFDGEYYNSVDDLLAACNITRADYTQVKATHRDWDAMNVVDFLVKSNKGVLPSKNPQYKAKKAGDDEPVINVVNIPEEKKTEPAPAETKAEEKVPAAAEAEKEVKEDAKVDAKADKADKAEEKTDAKNDKDSAKAEEKAKDKPIDTSAVDAKIAEMLKAREEAKVDEKVEKTEEKEKSVSETAPEKTKEDKTTMNEYDYTQAADAAKTDKAAAKPAPAPSGSTAKAFDELLVNLNIAKEGFLVVKQVQSDMSDLDIVNAILTTKGNPIGETSKDFDELLANLNTPKIGFQLVKQIHSDWSDLDVINAIIKSR